MTDPRAVPDQSERQALLDELDGLEAAPHDGGLGDMLRAALVERIEHRLDTLTPDEADR